MSMHVPEEWVGLGGLNALRLALSSSAWISLSGPRWEQCRQRQVTACETTYVRCTFPSPPIKSRASGYLA
eukprot:9504180-Pyramimonas_sp.AAC.2